MYTPGPPVRDKYWLPLGLNWNGKLRERAFADARSSAPDILCPEVDMEPHSLLSNHRHAIRRFFTVQMLVFSAGRSLTKDLRSQGETNVIRSDILYDCGDSLNPIIDMGQAE